MYSIDQQHKVMALGSGVLNIETRVGREFLFLLNTKNNVLISFDVKTMSLKLTPKDVYFLLALKEHAKNGRLSPATRRTPHTCAYLRTCTSFNKQTTGSQSTHYQYGF